MLICPISNQLRPARNGIDWQWRQYTLLASSLQLPKRCRVAFTRFILWTWRSGNSATLTGPSWGGYYVIWDQWSLNGSSTVDKGEWSVPRPGTYKCQVMNGRSSPMSDYNQFSEKLCSEIVASVMGKWNFLLMDKHFQAVNDMYRSETSINSV